MTEPLSRISLLSGEHMYNCLDSNVGMIGPETLHQTMQLASEVRDRCWGKDISYSRKVFVPLTNMCRDTCGYCIFVKHPDSPEAMIMTPKQVLEVSKRGESQGCKEVLFSLGEKPEERYPKASKILKSLGYDSMIDYLRAMCDLVLNETQLLPHINAGTLNDKEILILKPVSASMGMMLETVSRRLTKKGNAHFACPDKVPVQRLRTINRMGVHKVPFTTGLLIGIGETWRERLEALEIINEAHLKYGHIQEVIIQNFKAKPDIAMANYPEPTLEDMLWTIAAARIILSPEISLQAPPNLSERHIKYLQAGINDWGGISPVTIDFINPEREWPEIDKLWKSTQAAGFSLKERLTVYPSYQNNTVEFLSKNIATHVTRLSREDGLALEQRMG